MNTALTDLRNALAAAELEHAADHLARHFGDTADLAILARGLGDNPDEFTLLLVLDTCGQPLWYLYDRSDDLQIWDYPGADAICGDDLQPTSRLDRADRYTIEDHAERAFHTFGGFGGRLADADHEYADRLPAVDAQLVQLHIAADHA